MYYVNSFSFCEKSLKAVKSRHSELSKMVRQAHVVQKIHPGSMIEQKNFFCKNTIILFDNSPPKILKAKNHGLDSLLTSK